MAFSAERNRKLHLCCFAGMLLTLALTGCKGTGSEKGLEFDPLNGDIPRSAPPPAPGGAPTARKDRPLPLPGLNDPDTTTSTAALSAGDNPLKDRAPKLRMDERTDRSRDTRARIDLPKNVWRDPDAAGVTLTAPEPLKRTVGEIRGRSDQITLEPTVTSNIRSVDQGLIQLQRKGAVTDLKTLGGGLVQFRAAVPNPASPKNRKVYEFRSPDALTAVRSVLAEIEQSELEQE